MPLCTKPENAQLETCTCGSKDDNHEDLTLRDMACTIITSQLFLYDAASDSIPQKLYHSLPGPEVALSELHSFAFGLRNETVSGLAEQSSLPSNSRHRRRYRVSRTAQCDFGQPLGNRVFEALTQLMPHWQVGFHGISAFALKQHPFGHNQVA